MNTKEVPLLIAKKWNGKIINIAPVSRNGGPKNLNAQIVMYFNSSKLIYVVIGISLSIFLLTLLTISWIISKIARVSQECLKPLSELEKVITKLQENWTKVNIEKFSILELESIRLNFVENLNNLKEAHEKLAKSKGAELAGQAYKNLLHDLQTPVASIRNYIKITNLENISDLEKEKARERIIELAEQILRQIRSAMAQLGVEVNLREGDVRTCVLSATEQSKIAALEKTNIEVRRIIPKVQVKMPHDSTLLGRAISNLVTNAMESAQSLVEVKLNSKNSQVSIFVHDDGPGLREEDVSLYLQGRGKSSKTTRLGIGLSSANHIVRSHGGKIIYHPSELGGACFEIRI